LSRDRRYRGSVAAEAAATGQLHSAGGRRKQR